MDKGCQLFLNHVLVSISQLVNYIIYFLLWLPFVLGCSAGFYRLNEDCVACPENSNRTSSTNDESECPCKENY